MEALIPALKVLIYIVAAYLGLPLLFVLTLLAAAVLIQVIANASTWFAWLVRRSRPCTRFGGSADTEFRGRDGK